MADWTMKDYDFNKPVPKMCNREEAYDRWILRPGEYDEEDELRARELQQDLIDKSDCDRDEEYFKELQQGIEDMVNSIQDEKVVETHSDDFPDMHNALLTMFM